MNSNSWTHLYRSGCISKAALRKIEMDIKPKTTTRIYAIVDKKADAIIAGLHLHKHEAAAVRMFTDVANDDRSMLHRHPDDFELVCIGGLTEQNTIIAMERPIVIITGSAWKAAQKPEETK